VDTLDASAEDAAHGAEQVRLDEIGTPKPSWAGAPMTVLAAGLGDAALQRLTDAGQYTIIDEPDAAQPPDVALVSTRLPRAELMQKMALLKDLCPLVVLAHTGGERMAVDVVRAGGRGVIAEGNEGVLRAFLSAEAHDTGLIEIYERQLGQQRSRGEIRRSQDPVTGLPNRTTFDARLAEASLSGDIPRVGFIRIVNLTPLDGGASRDAVRLVRKRLAMSFRTLAFAFDVELFSLDTTELGMISDSLSPNRAVQLGARLARAVKSFAPSGLPLEVALGHAGPEVSTDVTVLRQLAERAVDVAALEGSSTVISAETLSLGVSSTTELEAALRVLAFVEEQTDSPGDGEQVSEIATELAWELGFEGMARTAIQLAAHLRDVGKASLPIDALTGADLSGELLEVYRSHPVRSADYLRPLAGAEVAAAVHSHHERWDGTGFPDGLRGDDVPMAARIIAIAETYVAATRQLGAGHAITKVSELAGSALDPSLVELAVPLLTQRLATAATSA
jgi:GGDEF domain-containing protein